jgi:hypothetical protein
MDDVQVGKPSDKGTVKFTDPRTRDLDGNSTTEAFQRSSDKHKPQPISQCSYYVTPGRNRQGIRILPDPNDLAKPDPGGRMLADQSSLLIR